VVVAAAELAVETAENGESSAEDGTMKTGQ